MSAGETNASEPLMTCRNLMMTPKPGGWMPRDKDRRSLLTGCLASGMKVA
jgi:hypothetical protein